jgi:Ca-activated chloride channel family protein
LEFIWDLGFGIWDSNAARMNFASPHLLWLLWLLVPLLGLLIWSWRVRQRLLTRFISPRLLASLTAGVSKQRQKIRMALFVIAAAALIFSLARPQLGFSLEESKQSGLDIVVAIDTSKSMLADDVQPTRLQRAKLAAVDLMRLAQSDRLGLVAFAGGAFLQCPLSLDEEAFRQSVDFLDVNVIPQGGTALAEAIQTARAAFKEETENHKILVLFTDGEDNDDAEAAIQAARDGKKAGLRIFTIGVGTPNGEVLSTQDPRGNRIFIKDSEGNVVKSRLNENLLQQIAKETDGFYLPLTGARSMDVLYERGLAPLPKSESATRTIRQYHERFQWFIGAAILLLLAEMLFPERARSSKFKVQSSKSATAAAAAVSVLLLCAVNTFGAASDALKQYERGKFSQARREFERLAKKSPEDSRLSYNAGAAAFQDEDYDTALKHFNQTLSARDLKLQEQSYYNLGNTHFRLGEKTTDAKDKQQQWEQAVHQYENALKLDANDADAKFNMEVVKKKLEELKQQQQQQKQDKQDQNKDDQNKDDEQKKSDQQKKEDQQKKDDKSEQEKQDEQKKQEESQKKDQQSQKQDEQTQQDQQQAKDERGEKSDKSPEQQNYARVMQMTPQQAQQLLDTQKSEERAMIFQPMIQRTNKPKDRVFKDW